REAYRSELEMASAVDAAVVVDPIPTSAVLMASAKHIATKCKGENVAFLKLKELHRTCTKEMDAYAGCMYYHTNEFELCRKEEKEFKKACPLE
ncbi:hypothetical protein C3L33_14891, partial [Rhododendron williamsianum]